MFCHMDLSLGEPQNVVIAKMIYTSPQQINFHLTGCDISLPRYKLQHSLCTHHSSGSLSVGALRKNKVCRTGSTSRNITTNFIPSDFKTPSHQIP